MEKRGITKFTLLFAATSSALVLSTAYVVSHYLSAHSRSQWLALGIIVVGMVLTGLIVAGLPASRRLRRFMTGAGVVLVLCVGLSLAYGRVIYSRFGFTLYGLVPVPALDVTVDSRGLLWFRVKSHLITLEEVSSLLDGDVRVVIIGIGWDSAARVEDGVRQLPNRDVRVLPTPEAFELFNRLSNEGEQVVLLAHTTC